MQTARSHQLLLALVSLLPLLLNIPEASKLFWYADDIALLHELNVFGYSKWLVFPFGENFVPVFKILWSGLLFAFGGAYLPLVLSLWILHAAIVVIFHSLLAKLEVHPAAALYSSLCLAVLVKQVSLLMFSYHLTEALSVLFFLLSLRALSESSELRSKHLVAATVFLTLACLSFSRGAVMSFAIGGAVICSYLLQRYSLRKSFMHAIPLLLPGVLLFLTLRSLNALGSSLDFSEGKDLSQQLLMFLHYFANNPLVSFRVFDSQSFLPGFVKLAVIGLGFYQAKRMKTPVLFILLALFAFDLGNAILAGAGRYKEGLDAALVSRYQRSSLIAFLPFLALSLQSVLPRKPHALFRLTYWPALTAFTIYFLSLWNNQFYHHSRWQGIQGRKVLIEGKKLKRRSLDERPWQGIPPVVTHQEALAVTKKFNLH